MKNDGASNEKKFLDIIPYKIRVLDNRYIYYLQIGYNYENKIQVKDIPAYDQYISALYDYYTLQNWVEKKKDQLWE